MRSSRRARFEQVNTLGDLRKILAELPPKDFPDSVRIQIGEVKGDQRDPGYSYIEVNDW